MRVDDAPNDLERKSFGRRVNREYSTFLQALRIISEIDVLPRLQLSAVKEAHASGEKKHVVLGNRAIEKWLAWPRRFDYSTVVADYSLKNSQTFARRDDSFGNNATDDR